MQSKQNNKRDKWNIVKTECRERRNQDKNQAL